MRIPSAMVRSPIGINLTPMIDVTFQLIIFFLVSSHLAKQEAQMILPLPIAPSGEEAAEATGKRLTLNVLADGALLLVGHRLEVAELPERLATARRDVGDHLEVRIRADRAVPYHQVSPVLSACARAGIWDVKFSVYHPDEVP